MPGFIQLWMQTSKDASLGHHLHGGAATATFCSVLGPKKAACAKEEKTIARDMLPTELKGEQSERFRQIQVSPLFRSSHSTTWLLPKTYISTTCFY